MKLTPDEFAKQLPKWYEKYRGDNPAYFPVEERLTRKAMTVGFVELSDLVEITRVLGNPRNIRGRIQKANTNDAVKAKTSEAIGT